MTIEFIIDGVTLDTNDANAEISGESSKDSKDITVYIVPESGNHGTHTVKVRSSPNDTDFITQGTITGADSESFNGIVANQWKVEVGVPEGGLSTVKVYILGI